MCNASNIVATASTYMNRLVDHMYLPNDCSGKYYIPVDALSGSLNIHAYAAGNPWINLTDANGRLFHFDLYNRLRKFGSWLSGSVYWLRVCNISCFFTTWCLPADYRQRRAKYERLYCQCWGVSTIRFRTIRVALSLHLVIRALKWHSYTL